MEAPVARIHLLPARDAPVVAILRRKPSKQYHVLKWDLQKDEITPGSWFRGRLFPERCDLSFNGEWLVYLAMGSQGNTWNGICRLPWLKTIAEGTNLGTWGGGGYWARPRLLRLNGWELAGSPSEKLPFQTETYNDPLGSALFGRLLRDGWTRNGSDWFCRPSRQHPTLRMSRSLAFDLDEHPGFLDGADWAAWDVFGGLVVARGGSVERYTVQGLASGRPDFSRSFEELMGPE
jgi:hypothetical protein